MKKNTYYNNDICIVGIGCVLPDADNPAEFWDNILKGRCSIKEMPEKRFKKRLYYSADKAEKDKAYSNIAAFVEDGRLQKICANLGLDFTNSNRLQIMSLEAARQAIGCLSAGSLERSKKGADVFLGCMEIDEDLILEKIFFHDTRVNLLMKYIKKGALKNGKKIYAAFKKHFNHHEMDDNNDSSIIIRLDYQTGCAIFTGDAPQSVEKELLAGGAKLDCDLLKLGHHGSKTSSSQDWLKAVNPALAIIQVGENKFGHPSPEVLDRLTQLNIPVLTTQSVGDIIVNLD